MACLVLACLALLPAAGASDGDLALRLVARYDFESPSSRDRALAPEELSGITWLGGDDYLVVGDEHACVHRLRIHLDPATGRIEHADFGPPIPLRDVRGNPLPEPGQGPDREGIAFDPATRSFWIANERTGTAEDRPSLARYDLRTGRLASRVDPARVPALAVFSTMRPNLGFESLTRREDGSAFWTANEEALEADGARSTEEAGSLVRLVQLDPAMRPRAQYPYRTEPRSGPIRVPPSLAGLERNGVSDLAALGDGRLLVLERDFGGGGGALGVARDWIRIFVADPRGAGEGEPARVPPLPKQLLLDLDLGPTNSNFEGMTLGPWLAGGERALVLVADNNGGSAQSLLALRLSGPPGALGPGGIAVIPRPMSVETPAGGGAFVLGRGTAIQAGPGARETARMLASRLRPATGLPLEMRAWDGEAPLAGKGGICLRIAPPPKGYHPEGYLLDAGEDRVLLEAPTPAGLFYACQTLRQLLPPLVESRAPVPGVPWILPCVTIRDRPRYRWRGLMIDSCRHFQPKEEILRILDWMACYKLNRFHWHLTDDEAWRLEIRKYPELTEIGAWRGDGAYRYGGFYRREDVREVVARAHALHIEVIPEIEMPGHAMAALAAHPEVSCAGKPIPYGGGGLRHFNSKVGRQAFCAGREETFTFLEDVLTEVMELFDAPAIHIGGDERPAAAWKTCPRCQARIRAEGLKDESGLQSWFVRRIEAFLNARGRRLIGWDEILEGGLAPNATVMSWRGTSGGIAAARMGHDVIMSPTSHCYFDYRQGPLDSEPAGRPALITPATVYAFEPTPDALDEEEARHVLGAQANVWTEYIPTSDLLEYMIFPRLLALAEVVWSPREGRDPGDFERRMLLHFPRMAALGIRFRVPDPQGLAPRNVFAGETEATLSTRAPGGVIRYTLDGSIPNEDSRRAGGPIRIERDLTLTARVFLPDGRRGNPVRGTFRAEPYREPVETGEGRLEPGVAARLIEGSFRSVADLAGRSPARAWVEPAIALPARRPERPFGCDFTGLVRVPRDGVYTFFTRSDDGSRLWIGGDLVVDNDGPHAAREASGQVALRAGLHPIRVAFFQAGGAETLVVEMEGPGLERGPIPPDRLFHSR